MKKATLKTANICTFKFRKSNVFFHCCYGDWWARKKEMPYASSVCFSLENVSVTFELSSEKNKLEFKLKKIKIFYLVPQFGGKNQEYLSGHKYC